MSTPLKFHWFLPTNGGDSRHVVGGGHGVDAGSAGRPGRRVAYLGQIARSAEQLGFEAALTPTGAWCEDAWLTTAMLSQVTERLKFLVAFRPGLTSPTLAAQMAATFQNLSGGRLLLNVVTGGESHEQRDVRRLPRQGRPLRPLRRVPARRPPAVGRRDGRLRRRAPPGRGRDARSRSPTRSPRSTSAARRAAAGRVAAKHADVYLTWGEPPAAVAEKVEWIRKLAADEGREIRFGIRMHTITRDTAEEAWAEADRLLAGIDDETIAKVQAGPAAERVRGPAPDARPEPRQPRRPRDLPQPVGRRRPGPRRRRHRAGRQPRGGRRPDRGVRRARHRRVRPLGYPHLEGAYWFGEGVLPILRERGLWTHPAPPPPAARRCRSAPAGGRRRDAPAPPSSSATRSPVADPRRRRPPRPRAGRRSPTWSSTSRPSAPALLDWARPARSPGWSSRSVRPTSSSSRARPTRPPTPGCSSSSSTGSPAARACRGVAVPLMLGAGPDPRPRARSSRCARCSPSSAAPRSAASTSSTPATTTPPRTPTGSTPTARP